MKWQVLIFMGLTVLFNSAAHILMKYDTRVQGVISRNLNPFTQPHISILFILGAVCFATSIIFYRKVLDTSQLSFAYAILNGTAYVLIILFSILMFRERLHAYQYAGLVLVFIGLVLLFWNYSPEKKVEVPPAAERNEVQG